MSTAPAVQPTAQQPTGNPEHIFGLLSPDLGQAVPVVNMHFFDVKESRPFKSQRNGGYRTHYNIKGAKTMHDVPGILVVMDAIEKVYLGGKRWGENYTNTTAPQIARDLVKCGSGAEPTDASAIYPSVWISQAPDCPKTAEQYATFKEAWGDKNKLRILMPHFAQEIEQYRQRQYKWCELQVRDGDQLAASPRTAGDIGLRHRMAAAWIGANANEHPWMDQSQFGKQTSCPFCGAVLAVGVPICNKCSNIIDQEKYDAIKAKVAGGGKVPAPATK